MTLAATLLCGKETYGGISKTIDGAGTRMHSP